MTTEPKDLLDVAAASTACIVYGCVVAANCQPFYDSLAWNPYF